MARSAAGSKAAEAAVRLPDPQRSRVFLLGTSAHSDEALPDLPAVKQSVEDLATALTDPVYGIVPAEHCTLLVDQSDLRSLGRDLRTAAAQAEDLLLVYYSGHGLVGGRRHELYLALRDTEYEDPDFSALEYDKLRAAVLNSPASTKVIVLDCCFSGRVTTDTLADPATELIGQVEVDGTYVLASAPRDQVALILPGEEHTAFTGRLLRVLREGVPGGAEYLTIDDLFRWLHSKMKAENLPLPRKRGTGHADRLALARNRAFAETAAVLLRERFDAAVRACEAADWTTAVALLRDLEEEQTRILEADHEDTLRTRQYLAHALGAVGEGTESIKRLRQLVETQSAVLGADHADTLRTRQFLAFNLGEAGYRDEAVRLLRVLLPDRRRLLGWQDPHTLRTAHVLARNLAQIGELEEAEALLLEIAATRKSLLGAQDVYTVRAQRDSAAVQAVLTGELDV